MGNLFTVITGIRTSLTEFAQFHCVGMQVYTVFSKIFPQICHLCSNNCSCNILNTNNNTSRKAKRPIEDDKMLNAIFGSTSKTTNEPAKKSKSKEPSSEEKVVAIFDQFAEVDDPELMTMDGIANMFNHPDIGIDPSADVRALVIMWRLGATSKPGCITKQEFVKGMQSISATSLSDLKQKLKKNNFDIGFLETKEFRGIW